ncbi:hypothetical protein TrLO_g15688 [Triparma laevis f. longispina]|uniref:Mitotic-spindle organizing protein 1 n=1 Tax=Triparma laevis f. longispina TaxID=1714387 RepID=A0A9W7FIK6_9STRA|nr:hypothetical protein TrLO_g15688 [Triparma laevis f. longispina]
MSAPSSSYDPLDAVNEISDILNTGLDRTALKAIMDLVESGVAPEALVAVVEELRKEKLSEQVQRENNDNPNTNTSRPDFA